MYTRGIYWVVQVILAEGCTQTAFGLGFVTDVWMDVCVWLRCVQVSVYEWKGGGSGLFVRVADKG